MIRPIFSSSTLAVSIAIIRCIRRPLMDNSRPAVLLLLLIPFIDEPLRISAELVSSASSLFVSILGSTAAPAAPCNNLAKVTVVSHQLAKLRIRLVMRRHLHIFPPLIRKSDSIGRKTAVMSKSERSLIPSDDINPTNRSSAHRQLKEARYHGKS